MMVLTHTAVNLQYQSVLTSTYEVHERRSMHHAASSLSYSFSSTRTHGCVLLRKLRNVPVCSYTTVLVYMYRVNSHAGTCKYRKDIAAVRFISLFSSQAGPGQKKKEKMWQTETKCTAHTLACMYCPNG